MPPLSTVSVPLLTVLALSRPPAATSTPPALMTVVPMVMPPRLTISRLPGSVTRSPMSVTPDETTAVAPLLTIRPDMQIFPPIGFSHILRCPASADRCLAYPMLLPYQHH